MTSNPEPERMPAPQQITLTTPDDWHLHLRDDTALATVVPHSARQFARAIVMPNLTPPVTTVAQAHAYRDRILAAVPNGLAFTPLMTLYLTDSTSAGELNDAQRSEHLHAVKLYPAGATTNSDAGVTKIEKVYPQLELMQRLQIPLLVHGEVTDPAVDVFDREARFIDDILSDLVKRFPALKIVMEHITTREAAEFVQAAPATVAATITPQHLLYNRNEIFRGGIRPHYYCLPILKRERHRRALVNAATSGSNKFFLGTDSAPHATHTKENSCGCAGCYSASHALEYYATAFEQADSLDRLEGFASVFGAEFYGLPRNTGTITIKREPNTVDQSFPYLEHKTLTPLMAGERINWKVEYTDEYQ